VALRAKTSTMIMRPPQQGHGGRRSGVASGSAVSCTGDGSTSAIGAAISSLARAMLALPQALIRYNNRLAVTVQGSPASGVSSSQALAAMDAVGARTLPAGYRGAWTDISFQEKRAEGKTGMILAFAILFAYLFLVALYESEIKLVFSIPAHRPTQTSRRTGKLL
jgi:multidrug efflux pump subunit AcrB